MRILMQVCPQLRREQAAEALHRAEGSLKAAIVMQRLDVDLSRAQAILAEHDGRLRSIVG
jgi:N-acetylmuramic acid 6-phosphate (MurNAc-6-P) etherase